MIPYAICNVEKHVVNSLKKMESREFFYPSIKYDLMYMFERYGINHNCDIWLTYNSDMNGNEVVVKLGCLSLSYWTSGFYPSRRFQQLYLVDEQLENILRIKRMLVNPSDINIMLNRGKGLEIESKTADIVYSSNLDLRSEEKQMDIFLDGIRALKDDGVFYYIKIVEDYYASVYRLLAEFDQSLREKSLDNQYYYNSVTPAERFLNQTFRQITVGDYESLMRVDNVDDFIGFILSDPEFQDVKYQLFKSGISKFRNFLQGRIERFGGILINRSFKVYRYSHPIVYS